MINKFLLGDQLVEFYDIKIEFVPADIGVVRIYPTNDEGEVIRVQLNIGEFVTPVQVAQRIDGSWELYSHLRSELYSDVQYVQFAFVIQPI